MFATGYEVGRYRVVRSLGVGGQASVYLVEHRDLGSKAVLKVLQSHTSKAAQRLIAEGRAQARLNHPGIVKVSDVLELNGVPALVMEYVEGTDLKELIKRGELSMGEIETLMRQVIEAVGYAHSNGIVHRDLKPSNVLVAEPMNGPREARVCDFGLAKIAGGDGSGTRTGVLFGTPNYISPEQVRDSGQVDSRADIFSLGVMLYEAFTGQLPFEAENDFDTMLKICTATPTPLKELVPDLPEHLVRAIDGCLVKEVDGRIPSCFSLLRVLDGESDFEISQTSEGFIAEEAEKSLRRRVDSLSNSEEGVHVSLTSKPAETWQLFEGDDVEELLDETPLAEVAGFSENDAQLTISEDDETELYERPKSRLGPILGVAALLIALGGGALMMGGGEEEAEPVATPTQVIESPGVELGSGEGEPDNDGDEPADGSAEATGATEATPAPTEPVTTPAASSSSSSSTRNDRTTEQTTTTTQQQTSSSTNTGSANTSTTSNQNSGNSGRVTDQQRVETAAEGSGGGRQGGLMGSTPSVLPELGRVQISWAGAQGVVKLIDDRGVEHLPGTLPLGSYVLKMVIDDQMFEVNRVEVTGDGTIRMRTAAGPKAPGTMRPAGPGEAPPIVAPPKSN